MRQNFFWRLYCLLIFPVQMLFKGIFFGLVFSRLVFPSLVFSGLVFSGLVFSKPSLAVERLKPFKQTQGEVTYQLTVDYKTHTIKGVAKKAMAINGSIPAPTLYFKEGEKAIIYVQNNMKVETSVHWHGILLPNYEDGVPYLTSPPIRPGKKHRFEFTINQPPGTYWYHSHTGLQEQEGLFGAIVIEPKKKAIPYDRDLTLVLSDWTYENPHQILRSLKRGSEWYSIKKGTLISFWDVIKHKALGAQLTMWKSRMPGMDISDIYYPAFLINGAVDPQYPEFKAGEKIRLRLVNASASTYFWLTFGGGEALMIAADGVNIQPLRKNKILHAVAETYDFLLEIPTNKSLEFKASAQDGSGAVSALIGQGDLLKAPIVPAPDMIEGMKAMAKHHSGGHHHGHSSQQHKTDNEHQSHKKQVHKHQHSGHKKQSKMPAKSVMPSGSVLPDATSIQQKPHHKHSQHKKAKSNEQNQAHKSQHKHREIQSHHQHTEQKNLNQKNNEHKAHQTQHQHKQHHQHKKAKSNEQNQSQEPHHQHTEKNHLAQQEHKQKTHHEHKSHRKNQHRAQKAHHEHTQQHTTSTHHTKHDTASAHHTKKATAMPVATHYKHLKSLEKTSFPQQAPVREIKMDLTGNMWRFVWSINGKVLSEVDKIKIRKGEITRLFLNNTTMMHHPMHLHGHFFRVLNGQGEYSPLKHTVDVPPMEQVVIEFDPTDEKGDWFFHCHVLYHMKGGMSRIFSNGDTRDPRLKDYPESKVLKADRHWYKWGELDLMSHRFNIEAVISNTRNRWILEGVYSWFDNKYQWRQNFEVELSYERFLSDFFRLYGELSLENEHKTNPTETEENSERILEAFKLESLKENISAQIGIKYLLPYFFDFSMSISHKGILEAGLDYELMLLSRLELFAEGESSINLLKPSFKEINYEWELGLEYIINQTFALTGSYDNRFGWGAGLNLKF